MRWLFSQAAETNKTLPDTASATGKQTKAKAKKELRARLWLWPRWRLAVRVSRLDPLACAWIEVQNDSVKCAQLKFLDWTLSFFLFSIARPIFEVA